MYPGNVNLGTETRDGRIEAPDQQAKENGDGQDKDSQQPVRWLEIENVQTTRFNASNSHSVLPPFCKCVSGEFCSSGEKVHVHKCARMEILIIYGEVPLGRMTLFKMLFKCFL